MRAELQSVCLSVCPHVCLSQLVYLTLPSIVQIIKEALNYAIGCFIFHELRKDMERYKGKCKGHPMTGHQRPRGELEVYLYSFSTLALGGGGWSAPRPADLPPGKTRYPLYRRLGVAPGPVWTCTKNLAPTGIISPDRPVRSQSLYRLSYPAHMELYGRGQILNTSSVLVCSDFVGAFEYSRIASPISCHSVCLSVCIHQRGSHWTDFRYI
jgi:hypothetical protein